MASTSAILRFMTRLPLLPLSYSTPKCRCCLQTLRFHEAPLDAPDLWRDMEFDDFEISKREHVFQVLGSLARRTIKPIPEIGDVAAPIIEGIGASLGNQLLD